MNLETFFDLVPVKLVFLGIFLYVAYSFYIEARKSNKIFLVYYFVFVSILTLYLAAESLKKVFPYGVIFDLSIVLLLSYIAIWLESKVRNLYLKRTLIFTTLLLMVLMPIFYVQHKLAVGGPVNADSFVVMFQTNYSEAIEYVQSFTSFLDLIFLLLVVLAIYWITHIQTKEQDEVAELSKPIYKISVLMALLFLVPFERGLYNFPIYVFDEYRAELHELDKKDVYHQNRLSIAEGEFAKESQPETYILIIGESLNKHRMSIYGYEKDTTPELRKLQERGELRSFIGSYSNYSGTMKSLSLALTSSKQATMETYFNSLSFIDVFNAAGFETTWLGNQPLSNSYDMVLGYIAENAGRIELTYDKEFQVMSAANQKPDGVLLPLVEKELSREVDSNRLIVVHLMGSHTNYCHRYPPEFEVYKMGALEKFWMRLTKGGIGHSVACYENSIRYNDYVVSEIIKMLETKTEGNVSAMMYFADHSEDITRGKGHSSASFSYEMIESPAIVWLSDEYRAKYADKYQTINSNINQLFPNDYVFDSLIGLAGIRAQSELYCEECDITSSKYLLEPDKARTMHDRLPYVTEDNPFSESWR